MTFDFLTPGRIVFGSGRLREIGALSQGMGRRFFLVSARSMVRNGTAKRVEEILKEKGMESVLYDGVDEEPSPRIVDKATDIARSNGCDAVIALGGGSVIDTGKAVSGMVPNPGNIVEYLEGVGTGRVMEHDPLPMIAVPSTSGTGSERTKNAVITSREEGFKRSFRDERLYPDIALIDPGLTVSLPPAQTAASGMDALTQLIESYVSRKSTPVTDALALYGMGLAGKALKRAYDDGAELAAREDMALASTLSGICLANAGLGAAHGVAAALGCLYGIPHGIACAILIPHVMRMNARSFLGRFADVGRALTGRDGSEEEMVDSAVAFVEKLARDLGIPTDLARYDIPKTDAERIAGAVSTSSMSGNPLPMDAAATAAFAASLL